MFSCAKKNESATTATVVDNALVISLLSAQEPRVWRIGMDQFSNAAFEVKESQGKFVLCMKPANAPAEDVSIFGDRDKAVAALEAVTTALLHGKKCGASRGLWFWIKKFLKWVMIMLVILFVYNLIMTIKHGAPGPGHTGTGMGSSSAPTGTPVPAEQLLGQ